MLFAQVISLRSAGNPPQMKWRESQRGWHERDDLTWAVEANCATWSLHDPAWSKYPVTVFVTQSRSTEVRLIWFLAFSGEPSMFTGRVSTLHFPWLKRGPCQYEAIFGFPVQPEKGLRSSVGQVTHANATRPLRLAFQLQPVV